ncbi:ATP-binding cassette sub-family F member 3 [Blattella germanica]|nr:ATP-binding cassette sub-family F member 3 [Blattella germanica]
MCFICLEQFMCIKCTNIVTLAILQPPLIALCNMAACGEYIKSEFPLIDDDLYDYVEGILESGADDFEDSGEVYEAIGAVLHEVAEGKSELDISTLNSGSAKVLNAPVHLATMAANLENNIDDIKSIWVMSRDDGLKVDAKKLEKAEAKLQQKQEKRSQDSANSRNTNAVPRLESATASQVTSKKEAKMEDKGNNRAQDIRIENFDVAYGNRVLLTAADITLAYGRRYGLVGRNGLGKTTLLRMISSGQLRIPSHISVLHVEQEVVGDDTPALESVLQCDTVRENLLQSEREISASINNGPDLLLLDEPTNMLDIKAIIWLENYLQNWPTTLLVVSHDRNFLDTVPTDILNLHSQRIDAYRGNYENFEKTRSEKLRNQQREFEAQQQHRAHVQEFIDRFRYNANRASSVQSKIKMLEKLPELKAIEKEVEVVLKFPEAEALSPPILQINEVSFGYSPDKMIFTNVNLGATLESRICIVGDNGAGKTTLLKIIMGILTPTKGIRHVHRNLKFGYFSQHHVDQLEMNVSSVELLQSTYPEIFVYVTYLYIMHTVLLQGGVILVSHDERLIRVVCKELWVCGNASVKSIEGGFDEYRRIVERELEAQTK